MTFRIRAFVVLLCSITLATFVRLTPEWNFDVVCYDGVARIWLGETSTQAHANVYRELASTAPLAEARAITSLSEYREIVANSVEAFMVQLPMYSVKPLYGLLVAAIIKLGGNGIAATFQISAVAYGGFAALVLLSLMRVTSFWPATGVGVTLLLSPPFLEVGRLSTPDALSAFMVFAGLYALVFADRPRLGAVLLLLSIAVRPDNLILCLAVASWWWWKDHSSFRAASIGGAASMAVWLILNRLIGAYPWGVLFTHTYIRRLTDVTGVRSDVTWNGYLDGLRQGFSGANVLYPSFVLLFVIVTILGFMAMRGRRNSAAERSTLSLQMFLWSALAIHFAAFPMLADRFFVGYYACITVLTVSLLTSSRRAGAMAYISSVTAPQMRN